MIYNQIWTEGYGMWMWYRFRENKLYVLLQTCFPFPMYSLTHLPMDKMATMSQTIFHMHFCVSQWVNKLHMKRCCSVVGCLPIHRLKLACNIKSNPMTMFSRELCVVFYCVLWHTVTRDIFVQHQSIDQFCWTKGLPVITPEGELADMFILGPDWLSKGQHMSVA